MLHPNPILAAGDESELIKVIIGAVFFLFWVISSIASSVAKKNEEARRKRARDAIAAGVSVPPPLPGTRPQVAVRRKVQQRPPAVRRPAPVQRAPQQRRVVAKTAQPPPKPLATPAAPLAPVKPVEPIAPLAVARKIVRPPTANALRTWLQPITLRQQFILTEILQPPIALREPVERL